jgi:hypothetical protein
MQSDYVAARIHLERALKQLQGEDKVSVRAREALDLLIEAVVVAQHRRKPPNVVWLPTSRKTRR